MRQVFMRFMYYCLVYPEDGEPTLDDLTTALRAEIADGNFGPYRQLRVVAKRQLRYVGPDRAYKVRVAGPTRDLALVRSLLRAEYGRLSPPPEDFPDWRKSHA
jgi:hypothetical protein